MPLLQPLECQRSGGTAPREIGGSQTLRELTELRDTPPVVPIGGVASDEHQKRAGNELHMVCHLVTGGSGVAAAVAAGPARLRRRRRPIHLSDMTGFAGGPWASDPASKAEPIIVRIVFRIISRM